jgi:hypothetical protein
VCHATTVRKTRKLKSTEKRERKAAEAGGTLAHFRAQLEDLRDTSLTLELNLSTFGTHSRDSLGYTGDRVCLTRAERGRVSSS